MTDLSGLIERVEAGVGPDRSIDAAIYHDLLGFCRHANQERTGAQSDTGFDCMDCGADSWGNKSRKGGYPAGQGLHDSAPRYTASLDAAMTLVPNGMKQTTYIQQAWQVRRLTPVECHRLQGFPDDHCAIEYRGKIAADGPQYKALGNSWAKPNGAWIIARIAERLAA